MINKNLTLSWLITIKASTMETHIQITDSMGIQ